MLDRDQLAKAIRFEGGLNRRLFLNYSAALSTLPFLPATGIASTRPSFSKNPFSLGVASGDPNSSSVVLWTRLAPNPNDADGGMPDTPTEVRWELANDESMKTIIAEGKTLSRPRLGHSVHVEAKGLKPNRWYWYRFHCGDATSPIGRTRTMPADDSNPEQIRFAFASCQHFEQGLYTAYEHMAHQPIDMVFHLGDYIYEYEAGRGGKVRTHLGKETKSLDDYRGRYAQYRQDPLLQGMHAQCPWFVTWDDHEFDNNYADAISEEIQVDPADFLKRRAAAYQAYYEMMPLRESSLPQGPNMQLFRQAKFGQLAKFYILDTRQYRTDQPNNDKKSPINEAALDQHNSMLGSDQRTWLKYHLDSMPARWNVLAQQVMMGMVGFPKEESPLLYSMDQWPGYSHERMELMQWIHDKRIPNPVVLTGDIHSHWANELRIDDRDPKSPIVATEFVGSSISSGGNGQDKPKGLDQLMAANPGVKFHNQQRGYVLCSVTNKTWESEYIVVDQVTNPGGTCSTRAKFVIEAGNPYLHQA